MSVEARWCLSWEEVEGDLYTQDEAGEIGWDRLISSKLITEF
jgi:hypothetical protein